MLLNILKPSVSKAILVKKWAEISLLLFKWKKASDFIFILTIKLIASTQAQKNSKTPKETPNNKERVASENHFSKNSKSYYNSQ